MKEKIRKICAVLTAAAGITLSCAAPAAAYVEETPQQEKETQQKQGPLKEREPDETESTPFSMPGNGQLLDDVDDDGTKKQFLTVQTKNGNTFYLVVDRSGNTENVYMMSLIDENDLQEFVETGNAEQPGTEIMEPVLDLETQADAEAEEPNVEAEKQKGGGMGRAVPILLLFGGCAAGAYYYFKVRRPQKEADGMEEESLEFYSDYEDSPEDGEENGS